MKVVIPDTKLREAASEGMDEFLKVVTDAVKNAAGNTLNIETIQRLTPEQVTLWGYSILHEELMDGGFIQLIYNGYGPFFFDNPFAKVMRLWGLSDLAKLIYKAKKLYDERKEDLTKERSDEEFMAMFEENAEFDELDDTFVEEEERFTAQIACYVDEHLDMFADIVSNKQ